VELKICDRAQFPSSASSGQVAVRRFPDPDFQTITTPPGKVLGTCTRSFTHPVKAK
jgi:hypothetical protein